VGGFRKLLLSSLPCSTLFAAANAGFGSQGTPASQHTFAAIFSHCVPITHWTRIATLSPHPLKREMPAKSTPPINDPEAYRTGILRIETNLAVTLARQNVSLQKVLGLVPGSMLIFDKHYAEPLSLEANGLPIATGETVKVGDKFGIRILQINQQKPQ
jgi:flagellar motor switch protein FliN